MFFFVKIFLIFFRMMGPANFSLMPGMEQLQPCLNVTPMAILMGQITQIATLVGTLMPVT